MSPLGKKVVPPVPPPGPEWKPHPTNKHLEVNTANGTLRTKAVPLPPPPIWGTTP